MVIVLVYLAILALGFLLGWFLVLGPVIAILAALGVFYLILTLLAQRAQWFAVGILNFVALAVIVLGLGLVVGYGLHHVHLVLQ